MSVSLLQEIPREEWTSFIAVLSDASIFHHLAWINLITGCYGYKTFVLASLDEGGRINGGIPFMEVHSQLTGHRWISLPFSDFCFPLFQNYETLESLIDYLLAQHEVRSIPRVEIRAPVPLRDGIFQEDAFVWHKVNLIEDSKALLKTFDKTRVREPIRQAVKRGVEVRWGIDKSDMDTFYRMLVITRQRLGVPVQPKRFFDLLWDQIIQKGFGFLLLANKGDTPVAGGVFLHYKDMLTAKYNASIPDHWRLRANNLLYWSAIQWGCEHGFTCFDFGRTEVSQQNLRDFKNGWGAIETPLIYSTIGVSQTKQRGDRLEKIMSFVIRKSPSIVCRALGEIFYKHYA